MSGMVIILWVKTASALPPRNMLSWPVKPFQRHRDEEEKIERHPQNCHIFTHGIALIGWTKKEDLVYTLLCVTKGSFYLLTRDESI